MATPLMKEYCEELKKCKEEFGEEVIIMMQVGSFYEIYQINEIGHAKLVSEILGIALSKKVNTTDQPYMCGFPLYTLGKFITKLNDEGYIVAVYDQKAANVKERFRKGVYRPSLRIELDDNANQDNRLMCIIFESYQNGMDRVKTTRFLISISCIDIDTGNLYIKEIEVDDWTYIRNIIVKFQPTEVLYKSNFEIDEKIWMCKYHKITSDTDLGILYKVFDIPGKEDVTIRLGIERYPLIAQCLAGLFHFIEHHDPCLMMKVKYPAWCDQENTFVEYNTDFFIEMNIMDIDNRRKHFVDKKKQKTLFDILNHTQTIMGKRRLKEMLRFPLCHVDLLKDRIDKIKSHRNVNIKLEFGDIDWLNLRWRRQKASIQSILTMIHQIEKFYNDVLFLDLINIVPINGLQQFLNLVKDKWDIDNQERILKNPSIVLKDLQDDFDVCTQQLKSIENKLNYTNELAFKLIKIDNLYYFQTTRKRWDSVKKSKMFSEFNCMNVSTNSRIYTEELHSLSRKMNYLEEKIAQKTFEEFNQQSQEMFSIIDFENICRVIAELDLWSSLSDFFEKNHYKEPEYITDETSMVEGNQIRHPIIEQIDRDTLFVPHDIKLDKKGMLIFGINSSGKSTYLKSIGLCVWLAQCGMFIPANMFRISPFKILMSKIGSYDNLYLGHSTFVAEMKELHFIIRKAISNRSLILCDELTSGTEIFSSTGIVASTIDYFHKNNISFIITTHLHLLSKIKEIKEFADIYHFTLETEKTNSLLIEDLKIRYNRTLKETSGPEMYGIEIANDMGLPIEFIKKAIEIRNKINYSFGEETKIKKSRYNKRLYVDKCFKCGSTNLLHTHHITPQSVFMSSAMNHHDKDGLYNLIILCEPCHHETHSVVSNG